MNYHISHGNRTNIGLFCISYQKNNAALRKNHFGGKFVDTVSDHPPPPIKVLLQLCLVVKEMGWSGGGGEKSCFFLPAPNNGLFLAATPCPPSLTY